ncbi:carboxyl transferase domain-containing protein [Streptomyces sp. NPDC057740]|uniref:carboxyl transferase domain-containing protein n=1 Tax=Streptomyces sp. NPDC057740 TaxID=3346234 RepID=UPI0036C40589
MTERRLSAREVVALVADEGSFTELPAPERESGSGQPDGPLSWQGYDTSHARARERTGEAESVVCGTATVAGTRAVLLAFEFGFLGGSLGERTGDRLESAYAHARAHHLPVVPLVATGGSRMQEGMLALTQLQRVARQSILTREAGLPQIAVLRDPTTGGGWATLGAGADVTLALPGAQIGFAGSRVRPPDADPTAYTAKAQVAAGAVDAVVRAEELRGVLGRWLGLLAGAGARGAPRSAVRGDSQVAAQGGPGTAAPQAAGAATEDAADTTAQDTADTTAQGTVGSGAQDAADTAAQDTADTGAQDAADTTAQDTADTGAQDAADPTGAGTPGPTARRPAPEARAGAAPAKRPPLDLAPHETAPPPPAPLGATGLPVTGWDAVQGARAARRPRAEAYLAAYFEQRVTVSGDRCGGADPEGMLCGFGAHEGRTVAYAAQTGTATRPAGYRTAARLIRLADRLGIPVLTLVDTPGAANDAEAERQGVGAAIADLFGAVAGARVPITTLVIGEGGSGGALALAAPGNTWATPDSYFSVIAPELAAAILKRGPREVEATAHQLRIRPQDLVELGVIRGVVGASSGSVS